MFSRIFIIFFLTVSLVACHKDSDSLIEETISNFSPEVIEESQGDIIGYVFNEMNQPVKDATVQIYSGMTKTNQYGVFTFKNARVDKNGTYIRVLKEGFIFGSDVVYPSGSKVYSYIKMMSLEQNKSFESQTGGVIQVTGGGRVIFPADAVAKNDGTAYTGKVNVTAKLISPLAPNLDEIMPGALVATSAGGNTVVLGTAGMVAVELRDNNGAKLNIRSGKKATLEMPALDPLKPATIPLWYFDESKGLWKEEGMATLQNDFYVGDVSHFSFWNADVPYPLINVCGKVLFPNGDPAKQIKVSVMADGLNTSFGFTDANGVFCGKMPKGKVLTFKIIHPYCGNQILEKVLGPFDSNTELDPFIINVEKTVIFGTVKCNGVGNQNSTIVVKINDKTIIFEPKENGNFEYNLTSLLCSNISSISIFAFDNSSGQSSGVATIDPTVNGPILIETCINPCDFTAQLSHDCEVTSLTATVSGGSGNFSFAWNNGATTPALSLLADSTAGTYCVTITETTNNCSKTFCKQVNRRMEISLGNNCQNANKVQATVEGGNGPYSYVWSNGGTGNFIEITADGNYCVTVTDANGCSISRCKEISIAGLFIEGTPSSCNKDQFTLTTSAFSNGRISGSNTGGSTPGLNISVTYPIQQSVFQTGFNFSVLIWDEFCEKARQIQLPQFKGLKEPTIKNTSCDMCADGGITVSIDSAADCIQCTIGNTKIFKVTDLNTDVTAASNAQMLERGEYYIVVEDAVTGCYIAFRKVRIL